MPSAPVSLEDRREYRRVKNHARINFRQVLQGEIRAGKLADVSRGGCLLILDDPLKLSFFELIEMRLRSSEHEFPMMGYVRHSTDDGRYAGIQFHRYKVGTNNALDSFLWSLHVASLRDEHRA